MTNQLESVRPAGIISRTVRLPGFRMAGGYRCSHGHAWSPPDGTEALTCPVCGDTTVIAVVQERQAVFVVSGSGPAAGQDQTQSLPLPLPDAGAEHAATVAFAPGAVKAADTPDPSFSSLVVLLPEGDSAS